MTLRTRAFLPVRNVEAAVSGAFHNRKNFRAGARARESNIENGRKRIRIVAALLLNIVVLAIDLLGSFVALVELERLEMAAREQQTGAIGGRVVGEARLDAETRQLMRVRRVNDNVAANTRVCDLEKVETNWRNLSAILQMQT